MGPYFFVLKKGPPEDEAGLTNNLSYDLMVIRYALLDCLMYVSLPFSMADFTAPT